MVYYFSGMNITNVQWLHENIDHPQLVLLDGSLKKSNTIIPTALSFDWDKFSDLSNPLPHMMPTAEQFTQEAQALGINSNSILVVYDQIGIYSSARVWWMFRAMGLSNCFVLDGGLPEWLNMGYECNNAYAVPRGKGNFKAVYNTKLISNKEEVSQALADKNKIVIDARSADRFNGKAAEPRAGLRMGHMPNSINIPFERVLLDQKIRPVAELEKIFEQIGDKNTALIFSCGSGVTACIDALAATTIGFKNISIYDGSWSEWGQEP